MFLSVNERKLSGSMVCSAIDVLSLVQISDIDTISKAWGCLRWNGLGGKMHVDFLENRSVVK
jgi:hypothetical protein